MNEKINIQDLSVLIARKSKITKKETELFLKECFDTINEALINENSVKVKGLGSFKLSLVNNRESIDVATGERVLIPAHYKINYSPDNYLAQMINGPFSFFEPAELSDEDATNIIPTDVEEDMEEDEDNMEEESIEEAYIEKTTEEPIIKPIIKEPVFKNPFAKEPIIEEPIIEEYRKNPAPIEEKPHFEPVNNKVYVGETYPDFTERKRVIRINWKSVAFLVLILFLAGVLFFLEGIRNRSNYRIVTPPTREELTVDDVIEEDLKQYLKDYAEKEVIPKDTVVIPEDTVEIPEDTVEIPAPAPMSAPLALSPVPDKIRIVQPGDGLTTYALEEYGNRHFWIYIYEENKGRIKDPNHLPVGLSITIPLASRLGIDMDNEESVNKAKALEEECEIDLNFKLNTFN